MLPVLRTGDIGLQHEAAFGDLVDGDSIAELRFGVGAFVTGYGVRVGIGFPALVDEFIEHGFVFEEEDDCIFLRTEPDIESGRAHFHVGAFSALILDRDPDPATTRNEEGNLEVVEDGVAVATPGEALGVGATFR